MEATTHDEIAHAEQTTNPARAARQPANEHVDPIFYGRWSPRAFRDEPVPEEHVEAVLEAARWAPSSYNEQPWRFVVATEDDDRERFADALLDANRAWAEDAPILGFVVAKTTFEHDGRENPHARFDAGAAWMSLALQAHQLGLHVHAMGGIDYEAAAEAVGLPEDHEVVCAIALGYRAEPDVLPDEVADDELPPSDRKPLDEIVHEGSFGTA